MRRVPPRDCAWSRCEHLRRQGVAEQHAIVIVGNDCLRGETVDDFECVGRGGQGL